MLQTLNQLKH